MDAVARAVNVSSGCDVSFMQKLILWDVDGTLLQTGGVAAESMRLAMAQVLGPIERTDRTFYAGKTDWQIILETFPDLMPAAVLEYLQAFSAAYVAELQRRYADLQARAKVMPGVVPVLELLQPLVAQAPLTGNIAPVAQLKLDVLGLLPYLNLAAGAYGDDHHERSCLVPIAAARAQEVYGRSFTGQDIVVVGDTPNDIRCARANGARVVAVATGPYSLSELRAHQPDALLADLSDVDAALAAILGNDRGVEAA